MNFFLFKMKKETLILMGILVFSLIIRSVLLTDVPAGQFYDEIINGYEAYSVKETFKSSYGDRLPIMFFSWDTREPIYILTMVPVVAIFGNNIFAIRFTSVLYSLMYRISTHS